jgi:hypothetical protein
MKVPPDQAPRSQLLDALDGKGSTPHSATTPRPARPTNPRLLDSAVVQEAPTLPETTPVWQGESVGRRILRLLVRIVILSLVASVFVYWLLNRGSVSEEVASIRRLVVAGTRMLSKGNHPPTAPSNIVVQLSSDQIQVTAIALGHPKLAVINGKQVAEGDTVTVHTPSRSVAVTLRVLDISDREVKLSDGTQVLTAHLSVPENGPNK